MRKAHVPKKKPAVTKNTHHILSLSEAHIRSKAETTMVTMANPVGARKTTHAKTIGGQIAPTVFTATRILLVQVNELSFLRHCAAEKRFGNGCE